MAFVKDQQLTDTYSSTKGSDSGAGVKIATYSEIPGLTATPTSDGTSVLWEDSSGADLFRLNVTDNGYTFDVLSTQQNTTKTLNFGAIAAGGPKELIDVPSFPDAQGDTDTVRFDGLIFTNTADPRDAADNPGAANRPG